MPRQSTRSGPRNSLGDFRGTWKRNPEHARQTQQGPIPPAKALLLLRQQDWDRAMAAVRKHASEDGLHLRIETGEQYEIETGQQRAMRLWDEDQQVDRADQKLADTLRIIADGKVTSYTFTDEGELATLFGLPVLLIDGSDEERAKVVEMFSDER